MKNKGTKTEASEILAAALKLPSEARAAIAGSLIEGLDEEIDEDVEAAWAEEIARRLRNLDSGRAKTIPWSKTLRSIRSRWMPLKKDEESTQSASRFRRTLI